MSKKQFWLEKQCMVCGTSYGHVECTEQTAGGVTHGLCGFRCIVENYEKKLGFSRAEAIEFAIDDQAAEMHKVKPAFAWGNRS